MLPKAHLTLHARVKMSDHTIMVIWIIKIFFISVYSIISVCVISVYCVFISVYFLYMCIISEYFISVHSCHLSLISSASVRSLPFLSFIVPIFAWNVFFVSLIFLKRSFVFPILLPLHPDRPGAGRAVWHKTRSSGGPWSFPSGDWDDRSAIPQRER